jgi:hypothetical protein
MNATYQPQQHGKFQPEKILNVSKKKTRMFGRESDYKRDAYRE